LIAFSKARKRGPSGEEHVLVGLTERLVSVEAVAGAVRAYHEEMNRQNQARRAQAEVDRKTQRHLPVSLALLLR
jgi:site-specific DNA recombinase